MDIHGLLSPRIVSCPHSTIEGSESMSSLSLPQGVSMVCGVAGGQGVGGEGGDWRL